MSVEFSVSSKIKFGEFIIKGLLNGNREHSKANVSLNLRESACGGGDLNCGARWDFI